jgi:hypothetical protein
MPYPLSRAAAHAVLNAPSELTLPQAMRYGQLIGFGVSETLATAAVRTQLGRSNAGDVAAAAIACFLALNADTRARDVQQIVDYVMARIRGFEDIVPQPNFTLRGRTAQTVMLEIRRWPEEVNRIRNVAGAARVWGSCGVGGYEQIVIDESFEIARWQIVELTSSAELVTEGRAMRHCVATFAWSATRGQCAIFALRRDDANGGATKHVATIEIVPQQRAIVQIAGACNRFAGDAAMEIIARWAALRGLDMRAWRRP